MHRTFVSHWRNAEHRLLWIAGGPDASPHLKATEAKIDAKTMELSGDKKPESPEVKKLREEATRKTEELKAAERPEDLNRGAKEASEARVNSLDKLIEGIMKLLQAIMEGLQKLFRPQQTAELAKRSPAARAEKGEKPTTTASTTPQLPPTAPPVPPTA
ncbi:MAG: hypothetical protein Q7R81_06755 [Candidatus Peregrinibacteria bacterium]|nr:hypothetical protein [Candidatus Peregrinibacteria bacterium]